MSLTCTGDRGRGHPNSPIQAELQVVLAWGHPGIALTTAPLPAATRQGPRPCLCLWVPTGSQIPHSPRVTTQGPNPWCLPDASPTPVCSLGTLPQVTQGGGRVGDGVRRAQRAGAPIASPPHGPQPSPVSQALPVGLGLCQLQQPTALLFLALGHGDAGSPLRDGQLAARECGVRVCWSTLMGLGTYRAVCPPLIGNLWSALGSWPLITL